MQDLRMYMIIRRKHAKEQWLKNPSQINGDNIKNVWHEKPVDASGTKRECLKVKINETEKKNSKNKNEETCTEA
jgi:hypothetical protein